ncbi:MAG TPA: hypothetical protein VL574_17835 [Stellaceae bacterium]|jgi:internalin A|nr:hypothetical protein [Stellaceae bacterium]
MKKYEYNDATGDFDIVELYFDEGLATAGKHGYEKIRIRNSLDTPTAWKIDLGALTDNREIKSLTIDDDVHLGKVDLDPIYEMKALQKLSINCSKIDLDFPRLSNLKILFVVSPRKTIEEIPIPGLEELLLSGTKNEDLEFLSDLKHLGFLRISGGKFIRFGGIEKLGALKKIRVDYCSRLEDISAIKKLPELVDVHIEKCPKIKDYSFLCGNDSIEELFVSDVDSLSFIDEMKNIRKLQFWNLIDGDMEPILKSNSLKEVNFYPDKKNYTHTKAAVKEILARRQ